MKRGYGTQMAMGQSRVNIRGAHLSFSTDTLAPLHDSLTHSLLPYLCKVIFP